MVSPSKESLQSHRPRDALFVAGVIAGVLLVAGFVGYGNVLATLPGLVAVVLIGSLVLWIGDAVR